MLIGFRGAALRALLALTAISLAACPPAGDDDDEAGGSGIVTFEIDGTTYTTEVVGANRIDADGFLVISYQQDSTRGDLGAIRGSISLASGYTGPGSYGPLDRTTDYGCNVTVDLPGGGEAGWQGPPADTSGDGAIVIDTDDGLDITGTVSWTAYLWNDESTTTPITGTFDVTAPEQE